jgi:hypothetical protein
MVACFLSNPWTWGEQLSSTIPFCCDIPPHHRPETMSQVTVDWNAWHHEHKNKLSFF